MNYRKIAIAILCTATASALQAQAAKNQPAAAASGTDDETVELSPFVVLSENDTGYAATSTLAGTRVRTELRDIASSLSVVTAQFLKDTGATNNESLLQYQTNTEVGGMYGNFAGVGNVQGASEAGKIARPNTNTRVRGLDEADNTRDYFLTDIPWDSYTVDRVDLQRGPNSILFGVGSPAGIINTTTIGARLDRSSGKAEASFGSYGSQRYVLDYNQVILPKRLALRVAMLDDHTIYRQDPAYSRDRRIFGSLRYSQQLFSKDIADKLTVRANAEHGYIRSNRPRMLPPIDQITPFFNAGVFARENGRIKLYDPYYSWYYGQQGDRGTRTSTFASDPDFKAVPGLGNDMGVSGGGPVAVYNNGVNGVSSFQSEAAMTMYGLKSDGTVDMGIDAFPFGRLQTVAGIYEYSQNLNHLDPTKYPAAAKGFYKDTVIQDPTIFDFYNKLIDGDNKREWTDFKSGNIAISQNFFGNRFGAEFVYDYQNVTVGQASQLGWQPSIGVDVNKYSLESPRVYTPKASAGYALENTGTGGVLNPNGGRAYITGQGAGSSRNTERKNLRLTAYGELRGADLFGEKSLFAHLFTRNVISGLMSKDTLDTFDKAWVLQRTDVDWAKRMGQSMGVNDYPRRVPSIVYLSDNLTTKDSASGLNIDRVRTTISPYGQMTGRYFDSTWKYSLNPASANYVDPAAPFTLPVTGGASTQSENPANYKGWTTAAVNILSADHGDINQLYTDASKRRDELESQGLTLQSFFWDDTLIPTVGWRKDKLSTYGTSGERDPVTQVANIEFANTPSSVSVSRGETTTWGLVARIPRELRRKMPWGTDVSLFFNNSENFRAVNRVGFDTKALPNPKGQSKDYGVVLSALEDRISLKVTWYDTKVKDADIPGGNALGQNVWFLNSMQAWGTAACQIIKAGRRNEASGLESFWDYAMVDENKWGDPIWTNGTSPEVVNHPSMVKQLAAVQDWLKTMPNQSYFDAYGYAVNVAKAQSSDWNQNKTAIANGTWNMYSGIGSIQPANGNRVNGQTPVGTIDQESKGVEFELTAQPLRHWDLSVNVAKTQASRGDLGTAFVNWIEGQKTRLDGPAGDLRLWWGGDQTYRQYYDQFIYQAYLFQKEAKGQMAPEIRPWRFNLISNYRFEHGFLKGVNVGGGYRWQDDVILGYRLNDKQTQLDVNRPIKGASEDGMDLWAGYERQLTKGLRWRVQLNLRNVGDKAHLVPVSANPDGSYALMRVVDGMQWTIRNTFEF
jgi:outer membrane receptor protein involved in Fe transport